MVGPGLALALLGAGQATARPVSPPDAGVVEPDRDHDGIPDSRDACPDEPEVWNGYQDADGCPDPAQRWPRRWGVEITARISFARGSHALDSTMKALVETVAAALEANPRILRVEVQGYAADGERHPARLAAARAATVLDALVAGGVAVARLQARGYGVTHPLCSGHDEACRSRNRRVSFSIVGVAESHDGRLSR